MFIFIIFIFCRILLKAECRMEDGGINNIPPCVFSNPYIQLLMRGRSSAARRMGELCIFSPNAYRRKNGILCYPTTNGFHSNLPFYDFFGSQGALPIFSPRVMRLKYKTISSKKTGSTPSEPRIAFPNSLDSYL